MSEFQELDQDSTQKTEIEKQYHQQSIEDGYRGIRGAIIGTMAAELILWFGQTDSKPAWLPQFTEVNDNIPLIFAVIGFMFTLRHLAQIWQAKTQLKQLSLDEQSKSEH